MALANADGANVFFREEKKREEPRSNNQIGKSGFFYILKRFDQVVVEH